MPAVTTYTRSNDDSRSNAANALQKKQPVAGVSAAPPRSAPESEADVAAKSSEPVEEAAQEAGRKQIADGYRLLRAGFVKRARERFELAMKSNAAEASLWQGRSLDPIYLKTVAFPDVIPDAEPARRMYRRAILLGNMEAKADLGRLDQAVAADAPTSISPVSPAGAARSRSNNANFKKARSTPLYAQSTPSMRMASPAAAMWRLASPME
jgi:hypothetical protein